MSDNAKERILVAFRELALAAGFDAVSVRDVVARADVARSTFYENFENKDDGIRALLAPMLIPLADACLPGVDRGPLRAFLQHVRETPAARVMLTELRHTLFVETLAELTRERLETMYRRARGPSRVSLPLVAAWLAQAEIGVVETWLAATPPAAVEDLVALIVTAARSCAEAFLTVS